MKLAQKTFLLTFLVFGAIGFGHSAQAITILKDVKVETISDSQISLHFDRPVSKEFVQVSYLRNIIQFSIKNVSVYPAKIETVDHQEFSKVFAYQYTPTLIRTRLTMQEQAEKYKDRLVWNLKGKVLSVKIKGSKSTDQIVTSSAQTLRKPDPVETKTSKKKSVKKKVEPKEEAQKQVFSEKENLPFGAGMFKNKLSKKEVSKSSDTTPNAILWLLFIFSLISAFYILLKKVRGGEKITLPKMSAGFIRNLLKGKKPSLMSGASKKHRVQVISNHYLGPKKNIAVVKVGERELVLGITDESINLITDLQSSSSQQEEYGDGITEKELKELDPIAEAMNSVKSEPQSSSVDSSHEGASPSSSNRPAQAASSRAPIGTKAASSVTSMGAGAESAGPAQFADALRKSQNQAQASSPEVKAKFKTSSSQEVESRIRERIRNRIRGMKQL